MRTIAVVGASLAGFRVVQELRRLGNEDRIVLLGAEQYLPYDRPPLSKGLLSGSAQPGDLLLTSATALDELNVEHVLGETVVDVNLDAHRLTLTGGATLGFDRLVVSTGARARRLAAFEGRKNVHYLRTLDDAQALRDALATAARLVIVGGGLIGAEVAGAARVMGLDVTIVDSAPQPFRRTLGAQAGDLIEDRHRASGVTFEFDATITEILGQAQVEFIRLSNGRTLAADAVLIGVGAVPNTEFLRNTLLDVTDGVLCDASGRCAENVWAAGDVARWSDLPGGASRRFEHWSNAADQARTVARNVATGEHGEPHRAPSIPYFWTDQYEYKVQVFGTITSADEYVELAAADDPLQVSGLYCHNGRVRGGVVVNSARQVPVVRRYVAERTPIVELQEAKRRQAMR